MTIQLVVPKNVAIQGCGLVDILEVMPRLATSEKGGRGGWRFVYISVVPFFGGGFSLGFLQLLTYQLSRLLWWCWWLLSLMRVWWKMFLLKVQSYLLISTITGCQVEQLLYMSEYIWVINYDGLKISVSPYSTKIDRELINDGFRSISSQDTILMEF